MSTDDLSTKLIKMVTSRENHFSNFIKSLYFRYPLFASIILLLFILFTINKFFNVLVKPWIPEDSLLSVYLAVIVPMGVISYTLLKYKLPTIFFLPPPEGEKFQVVGDENIKTLFERKPLKNKLIDMLYKYDSSLIIVSGESGTGKSTFVKKIVVPEIKRNNETLWCDPIIINGFLDKSDLKGMIRDEVLNKASVLQPNEDNFYKKPSFRGNPQKHVLFIFDQFEQFIIQVVRKDDKDSKALTKWFIGLIHGLLEKKTVKCLIVLRREFFYDLRFLSSLSGTNIFQNTIPVESISFHDLQEDTEGANVLETLKRAMKNSKLYNIIAKDLTNTRALPLEIQMIGLMIEDMQNQSLSLYKLERCRSFIKAERFLSKKYLIRRYFMRHINSTTDHNAAMAVLFALSGTRTSMTKLNVNSLSKICHLDTEIIDKVALQLKDSGLIKWVDDDHSIYYLPHDYLSDNYHVLSGSLLDPTQRDTITYFFDLHEKQKNLDKNQEKQESTTWVDMLFICLFALLVFRLFAPLFNFINWNCLNRYFISATTSYYQKLSSPVDLDYLPSFIASCISCWYVWRIHKNFILKMRGGVSHKLLTFFVIVLCSVAILSGMFLPHAWLLFASIAGALIALRVYISVPKSLGFFLSNLWQFISGTSIAMLIAFSLGLFIAFCCYFWPDRINFSRQIVIIEIVLSLLFFVFMITCCRRQVSKDRGSLLLSLWDRYRYS